MEKICFVIPNLKVAGSTRVFVELANELVEKEVAVEIIYPVNTSDKATFSISPKISITPIGKLRQSNLGKIWNFIALLLFVYKNRRNHKVVITDPFVSILFHVFPKKKLYRYVQGDDYAMFDDRFVIRNAFALAIYKKLILLSYRKKVKYIFNSRFSYNKFLEYSKRKDVPERIVHPALNAKFKDKGIRVWGEKINICLVARMHPLKGFADFISAWKKVKPQLKDKVENIFAISHDNLDNFDMEDFTRVHPKADDDITRIMNQSHLFISSSWSEGFGLPPLEAMACGCACITSQSGGVLEFAKDNENCLIYAPKNIDALAAQLVYAANNRDLLMRLGRQGELTAKNFTWKNSALQFLNCISDQK